MSTGEMSVSNIVANDAYSASVNPPVGFAMSATTIASDDTAATRATTLIGFVQFCTPLALSVTSVPIVELAGIVANDARWRYHACAAGIFAVSSARADS